MDVISYDKEEIDSEFIRKFQKNPQLTKYISKLADQYNKYKGKYVFPTKYKGIYSSGRKSPIFCFAQLLLQILVNYQNQSF